MKSRICILGLSKEYTNKIAENLAKKLDMFYLDVDALVEYEIVNPAYIEMQCGVDYLAKLQRDCVKRAVSFENSLLTMDYTLLNDKENLKAVKKECLIIYVNLSKESYEKKLNKDKIKKLRQILDVFMFNERNKICESIAEISIDSNGKSYLQVANLAKIEITNYYKNVLLGDKKWV